VRGGFPLTGVGTTVASLVTETSSDLALIECSNFVIAKTDRYTRVDGRPRQHRTGGQRVGTNLVNRAASTAFAVLVSLAVTLFVGCAAVGPATAAPTCSGSLQTLVNGAAPGDVVQAAGGCVYRETVTIAKPLTLQAAPEGSEIRGSELWGDSVWTQQGSTWVSGKTVPSLSTDKNWQCEPKTSRCRWPEQVFIDGSQLTQVPVGTTPGAGQFALNTNRKVILGENPTSKTVEVSVRNHWVVGAAGGAGVTIDGFTMKHAASEGVSNNGNDDWTIKNGDYSFSHTSNILLNKATGLLALNNKIHHGGQKGVASNSANLMLQGNEIYANNTEGFKSFWNAGGVKVSNSQTVTFAGNIVYDNRGNGLWLDVPADNQVIVVENNRVHHNDANGIRSEVTDDNVQIHDNVVWENGWGRSSFKEAGISLNASQNNHVYNNVVAWNENGIMVLNPRRSDVHRNETEYDFVYNVEVDNNDILMDRPPDGAYALGWVKTNRNGNLYDPAANNRGHDNRYWYPFPEGYQKRYAWEVDLASLGAFNDTLGEEGGRYLWDAEKDEVVTTTGIPDVPPPPPDNTAPSVAITTPPDGAIYALNQTVNAQYSCKDEAEGSGVASCQGPVAPGNAIDVGSVGTYAFTVTATDNAGNATSVTHTYTVSDSVVAPGCTKTGTSNAETISGTSGDDVICAGGGNDTIKGLEGNDILKGEAGNDTLLGGVGDDTLDGGLGTDLASYSGSLTAVIASLATNSSAGEGSDTFSGVENLLGSPKADTLTGSPSSNALTGGGGGDTESGGAGSDKVVGGSGADTLKGDDGADTINSKDGVNGNDSLDGGAGTDTKVTDASEKSVVGFP
jgi:Ca2+-binding RTX toxin-like protein